jgi:hypothetical protein
MPGEITVKHKRAWHKWLIAFGLGIAATLLYQCLSSPTHQTLASEKSPDGKYVCVIDQYSPLPWGGPPVPYLVFKICDADDLRPLENESQTFWYEYQSRGRGIDVGSLKIGWHGNVAVISDDLGPAAAWNPIDQWNAPAAPAVTQPASSAPSPATQQTR